MLWTKCRLLLFLLEACYADFRLLLKQKLALSTPKGCKLNLV